MTDIHSCSYYCDRAECIKAQRDELREKLAIIKSYPGKDNSPQSPQRIWVGLDYQDKSKFSSWREQPEQEPVALESVYETIIQWDEGGGKRSRRELARRIVALYTTPPQRKPLTDEQIEAIHQSTWIQSTATLNDFARAIEAAHGIKENT